MTLPILPTAPSRTDPTNFSVEADAWVAALGPWTDAANAMEASLQTSNLVGTSTTSLAVGTGSKGFTTQAGKAWIVGSYVFIVATSDRSRVMQGKVTAYNSGTGSLVVDVNISSGSGTYASWDIGIANPSIGATSGVNIAGSTLANWFGFNTSGTPSGLSTGIAAPASDTLGLYTNTVKRVEVDSSGNVGIGKTPGVYRVDVSGDVAASGGFYTTSADGYLWAAHASGILRFGTANAERMRIDTSGNAGLGTTPSAWNSSIKAFDISTGMSLFYSASGVSSYGTNTYLDGASNYIRKVTGYATMYQQNVSDGSHVFYSAGTGTAGTTIASWTPILKLDASGNTLVTSNGGLGYGAGSGGTVTQNTSKSTGVTLNKVSGQITMNAAALAANTSVSFSVSCSAIAANDVVVINLKSGFASNATYQVWINDISSGQFVVNLRNISAGSLSEAVVLSYVIIRGSTT